MNALTVYADILMLTNLIVDYFLLAVTAKITRQNPSLARRCIASFLAAASTLIIFLPEQNRALELLIRLFISFVICLAAFGYKGIRRLISSAFIFLAVNFAYAGAMLALYYIFKPSGMAIKSSVVYFDISPVFLIVFSVAGFLISSVFTHIFALRHKRAVFCFLTLSFCGKTADFSAVIDTGNSITDPFGGGAVIIADRKKCRGVFGDLSPEIYPEKYRAVPCGTVSGTAILDGFRFDSATVTTKNKRVILKSPVIALSAVPLCDCEAIINPADID